MKIRSIKANAVLNIIYTVTNLLFPLITYPYVARILSADGTGRVNFFTAASNYAVMFAALGVSTYGVRAVAKVRDNKKELSDTLTELLLINLIATLCFLVVYAAISLFVPQFSRDPALCVVNAATIAATHWGMSWLYSGLEQYGYITKRTIVFKLVSLVLIFALIHDRNDYIVYAIILAFASVGSYICNFLYARKLVGFSKLRGLNLQQHISPMLVLFASSLAISVYTNLDTVMLGIMQNDREVGLYTTAVKVKSILLAVVNAISTVLLPRLSYYVSRGDKKEYNESMKKSMGVIFLITFPLTIFFIENALDTVLVLGGNDYVDSALCMKVLMPILIISGFSNIIGNQVLIPLGKDKYFMQAVVCGALADFILNFILIPRYGCVGAAVATLFAEALQMSIQFFHGKNIILRNFNSKSLAHTVLSTCIAAVCIALASNLVGITMSNPLVRVIVNAVLYFSIYLVILLLIKNEYAIELVTDLKNRKKL